MKVCFIPSDLNNYELIALECIVAKIWRKNNVCLEETWGYPNNRSIYKDSAIKVPSNIMSKFALVI